jgi:SAM-dependent methyltransferase
VQEALERFTPEGKVLEFACGTGLWTQHLVRYAESVTAVDSAPEMLALNRGRLGSGKVDYVQADLFDWHPDARYDVVFFSFWLSHVPPDWFDAFWDTVGSCLSATGRVFFIDSLYAEASTARDQRLEGPAASTSDRRLNDGRVFRIVKVYYRPDDLSARLAELGWQVAVQTTSHYFLYGSGSVEAAGDGRAI